MRVLASKKSVLLCAVTVVVLAAQSSLAFVTTPLSPLVKAAPSVATTTAAGVASSATRLFVYIPSGFTPESYAKFKAEEAKKKTNTQALGKLGPRGFKSRSFQSFHEALERGEAQHLMPVFNAKEKVRKGLIKVEDIPYMQRGGSWDNSDVKGAKKKYWLASDKEYANGGFRKEQSVSIFGVGEGLDWTGSRNRSGPMRNPESILAPAPKFARNYKAPNVNDMKNGVEQPKKKLFGMF